MKCINPITLKDDTVVPCGYCGNCVRRKQQEWSIRIGIEEEHCFSSYFITLTYSNETLPMKDGVSQLCMADTQKFLKRLRKFQNKQFDGLEPIRYYLVGEYGEKYGRAHYHAIIFNLIPKSVSNLEEIWGKGRVHIGRVTPASVNYVTSYVITRYHYPGREPPFSTMSKKPGLGYQYLTQSSINFHNYGQIDFLSRYGVKRALPRYYFDRLFDYELRRRIRKRQLLDRELQEQKSLSESRKCYRDFFDSDTELNRYRSERVGADIVYTF